MALIQCHECGKEVSTAATSCPHCGRPGPFLSTPADERSHTGGSKTLNELDAAIGRLTAQGWVAQTRSATSAQMRRPKQINVPYLVVNLVLVFVFGIGLVLLIIQLILHAVAKDEIMMIALEADGGVYTQQRGRA